MQVWPIITVLCSATAVALSIPLVRRYEQAAAAAVRGSAIYRDQIKEVESDLEAGTINAPDAEAAKAEIQRRLVAAVRTPEQVRPISSGWRAMALASTAGFIILGSVNLYGYMGSPGLPTPPRAVAANTAVVPTGTEASTAANAVPAQPAAAGQVSDKIQQLAERMKSNPNDAEGWRMLGWSYFNTQNYQEAANAYEKALAIDPANPEYKSALAEALVQAAQGMVIPKAQALIGEVLAKDPKEPRARFYDALAREQAGDQTGALDRWLSLLADAPADAGWREDVRARVEALGKSTGRDVSAALAVPSLQPSGGQQALGQTEKNAMMDGMIAKLAEKLAANPKDRDGWAMMIRSLKVRGDQAGSDKALKDALEIFKDDAATVQGLKSVAAAEVGVAAADTTSAIPDTAAAPKITAEDQAAVQAMAPADQQEMIKGMVAKLASRLETTPNDPDGWIRLMRSYMVLNDPTSAKGALDKAAAALGNDAAALAKIQAAAAELGVK